VHISTSYCFYGAQLFRIAQSKGSTRLGISLPENRQLASEYLYFTLLYAQAWRVFVYELGKRGMEVEIKDFMVPHS